MPALPSPVPGTPPGDPDRSPQTQSSKRDPGVHTAAFQAPASAPTPAPPAQEPDPRRRRPAGGPVLGEGAEMPPIIDDETGTGVAPGQPRRTLQPPHPADATREEAAADPRRHHRVRRPALAAARRLQPGDGRRPAADSRPYIVDPAQALTSP